MTTRVAYVARYLRVECVSLMGYHFKARREGLPRATKGGFGLRMCAKHEGSQGDSLASYNLWFVECGSRDAEKLINLPTHLLDLSNKPL